MKTFTSQQIAELNKPESEGIFFEGLVIVRDPGASPVVKDYFARIEREFTLSGNVYQPLDFAFEGFVTRSTMEVPVFRVVISNLFDQVVEYIEDNDVVIAGNDVTLQILFMDRFGTVSVYDETTLKALFLTSKQNEAATLHVGLVWAARKRWPEDTIETQRYPGIRADAIRAGT